MRLQSSKELGERSGTLAEVCGVLQISSPQHAAVVVHGKVGSTAYLIEFGDGHSVEVAEELLQAVGDDDKQLV